MGGYTNLIATGISGILCILFPILVLLYLRKKEKLDLKPFFTGMIIFFVFALVLEQILHYIVLGSSLVENPIVFGLYGALAAGIFEETGRFVAFKTILKDKHEWKDGIAYGIGHGGIEAMLLGGVPSIILVINCLVNSDSIAAGANVSATLIGLVERIFAFGIQLGLSMVVLYAIRYRKNIFFVLAILLHALVDFPAVLYQKQMISNILVIEAYVAVCFIMAVIFLLKSKKIFRKECSELSENK